MASAKACATRGYGHRRLSGESFPESTEPGAVQSVIVELVKSKDRFTFNPGLHDRPEHEVDWFGDRGDLVGVYAYAVMHDRAISKVVIMSLDEIHEHRARSETWKHTWSREYSPWTTDFEAMVRKTAVRQLEKWVPTSTEYREQQFRLAEQARAQEVKPEPAPEEPIEAEVVGEPEGEVDGDLVPCRRRSPARRDTLPPKTTVRYCR